MIAALGAWLKSIGVAVITALGRWFALLLWDHLRAWWARREQAKRDTENGQQMRDAINNGASREERDRRGEDLLNGE